MNRPAVMKSFAYEMATLGILAAVLFCAQVVLAPVPNVEVVSLLVVLYTRHYRAKALAAVYAFVLLEGLLYGFGLWFVNYLYVWTILWLLAMLLRNVKSMAGWVLLLAGFGLCFGLLCAIPYLFIGGIGMAAGYFISGIPFDILHCAGNAAVAAVLFKPLDRVFVRMKGNKKL